ncbi:MAG: hypothetical protein JWO30_4557 [Fibrobacteres bacterium]|nr:hypothetical protein [Fibrobacterota bacterium]
MQATQQAKDSGFTLMELLVSLVIGSLLITGLFKIWNTNRKETDRIQTKSDFRDRATLATTALNRSITMAGFGMTKMDVITKRSGVATDTLILYSNSQERRTTLRDTARVYDTEITVFTDSGFTVGGLIGITDSIQQEYARVGGISGDSASGFRLRLADGLQHKYKPGVPDVYPVEKETFFIDNSANALMRIVGSRRIALANGITDFRVDLRDASGNATNSSKSIRVVTFSMTGTYKAPAGTPSLMNFSSTVIPRNVL